MKNLNILILHFTTILLLGLNSSCSWATERITNNENYFLVGCTPGDDLIKLQLGIQADTKIDFIRWDLRFDKSNTFVLNIKFGENQTNTLGFVAGGQSKDFQGTYTISKNANNEFYHLKAEQLKITLVKLNDNLFHLLTAENRLMVGNGGWSYTLNNKNPKEIIADLPILTSFDYILNDNPLQVIYDGRTPCQEFATEHQMNVSEACFKLKWKLTLNRDSVTFSPTTYSIRKVVDGVAGDITGTWSIVKGTKSNPNAIIYQLETDKANKTISLFVGDENVLYFLHKNENLFIGNDNFSFTLNKRPSTL